MAGTKVHMRYRDRTHNTTPVGNARKVLRSRDPQLSRESVIHALRVLYRHREFDFGNPDDVKLLVKHDVAMELVTLDNPIR